MGDPALGMDLRYVSKSPGLNRLLQGLLLHKWQDRPTAVQAQQILLDAHQQPELPQSSQVAHLQSSNSICKPVSQVTRSSEGARDYDKASTGIAEKHTPAAICM